MITSVTTIRVRYADTDKMQFVYNGKYLEYFEVGRTELLRNCGLAYSDVEKQGYQLPLMEAKIQYKKPAFYDDLLDVEATVKEINSAKVHIDYRIFRKGTDDLIAEGYTDHMFIKLETKKPTRPPKFYVDALMSRVEQN